MDLSTGDIRKMVVQIAESRNPPERGGRFDASVLAQERGFSIARLLLTDPIVAGDQSLSSVLAAMDASSVSVSMDDNDSISATTREAFNTCGKLLYLPGSPVQVGISLEERAFIAEVVRNSDLSPFGCNYPLGGASAQFLLNLPLMYPLPDWVRAKYLWYGVGHFLKSAVEKYDEQSEPYFQTVLSRTLACYNAHDAREDLESDVFRKKIAISPEVFVAKFSVHTAAVKLANVDSIEKLVKETYKMVQSGRHTFLCRLGGELSWNLLTILNSLARSDGWEKKRYHANARKAWVDSLKKDHPLEYFGTEIGNILLMKEWPLTAFAEECISKRLR